MRTELLERLMQITEEEAEILQGKQLKQELYTSDAEFRVEREKLMPLGEYIAARVHTRFVDFPKHGHNYIEIMYVCHGTVRHEIEGKEICMHAGDILFMNRHVKHSVKKAGREDIGINFIILPEFFNLPLTMLKTDEQNVLADFLIGTLRIHTQRPQYLHFCGDSAIENLMENIIRSLLSGDQRDANINQITMGLVFLHLLQNIEKIGKGSLQGYQDIVADTAISYIDQRYQDANLTELAKSMNQSVTNMSKMIKKSTGYTFLELLQRKRFQQAVIFLVETDLTIAQIMNAVGYENSSYFYRKFREKYKISPRDYRLRHRNDQKIRI